jgi:hypothetical protein
MPGNPGPVMFSECLPAVANGAIARLRPHPARAVREPLRAAGTVSLDADQHPMLSRPAELALILAGIVTRTTHAELTTS